MNNKLTTTKETLPMTKDGQVDWLAVRGSNSIPEIMTMSREQATEQMIPVIAEAYMFRGTKANAEDVKYIAVNVVGLLREDRNLRHLKIAEIRRAVQLAVTGRSIEMFGISVATVMSAINAHYSKEILPLHNELWNIRQQEEEQRIGLLWADHEKDMQELQQQLLATIKRVR